MNTQTNEGTTDWGYVAAGLEAMSKDEVISHIVGLGMGANPRELKRRSKADLIVLVSRLTEHKYDNNGMLKEQKLEPIENICRSLKHITGLRVKVDKQLKRTFHLGMYLKDLDPGDNEVRVGMVAVWERRTGQWEVIPGPTHNLQEWLQLEINGLTQEGALG